MENKGNLDSWDAFTGSFLKADMVDENVGLKCLQVTLSEDEDEKARPRLVIEKNGTELLFDLNKTNAEKCKQLGIKSPMELINKIIFFKKVLVTSPKTKQEVEGLRINRIG